MKFRFFFYLAMLVPLVATSQALQDINYSYLYRTGSPFSFRTMPVRTSTGWLVHFELTLAAGSGPVNDYAVQWEQRVDLRDKDGVDVERDSLASVTRQASATGIVGIVHFPLSEENIFLNARIVSQQRKQVWYFGLVLRDNHPVDATVLTSGKALTRKYVASGESLKIENAGSNADFVISYYSDEFPPAAPPFSEALARVSSVMTTDSTMRINQGQPVSFDQNGLYLVQRDTGSVQGTAFRVYDDYPKYSKLENLVGPLTYVCTRQELERLKGARGEKRQFDRIILNMTGDTDRARNFMRNYFRRVEEANEFFASYKEGWKTDRGMVYIIFGAPDEVFKFEDREVWNYDNGNFKINFSFVRSPTLFDPDNFVLVRQKKYMLTWYEVIDLWRNSRF